jgi:preprotein translocase subunit SecD
MSRSKKSWAAACAAALGLTLADGQALATASCPNAGWVVVEAKASPQTRPVKAAPKGGIFVRKDQITTTTDLTEIKLAGDEHDTQIQMTFTPEAAKRLHDATTNRSGIRIAFVTNDEVVSAVTWTGSYGMDADHGVQISLGGSAPQARPLVEAIEKCVGVKAR